MLCEKYQSKKCPARLKYEVDENNEPTNFELSNTHNHAKPTVDHIVREFKSEFKKAIMSSCMKPCIIYSNLCLRWVLILVTVNGPV